MRPKNTPEGRFIELEGKDIDILEFGLVGGNALKVDDPEVGKKIREAKDAYGNQSDYWKGDQVVTVQLTEATIVVVSLALQGFKEDCYTEVPTEGTVTSAKREKAFDIADDGLAYMRSYAGGTEALKIMQDAAITAKQARMKASA